MEEFQRLPLSVTISSPLRISFVGGGTDIESFYSLAGGAVASVAITSKIWVHIKKISANFVCVEAEQSECVCNATLIKNPIIRECLLFFGVQSGIELQIHCDVKSGGGLATSSALCCALVLGLSVLLKGEVAAPNLVAETASRIEIHHLGRPIGKQDHYASAFGGFRHYRFLTSGEVAI